MLHTDRNHQIVVLTPPSPLSPSRPQQHLILVNMEPLRAIILRDRCLVLPPEGADSVLNVIMEQLKRPLEVVNSQTQLSFELRAMEVSAGCAVHKIDPP